jgi:site-specific recombinase XerD
MIDDMQLKGLSASTQVGYLNAVRRLAEHYHRSPDQLSEEDLRQYFLYLAKEKKVARSTATIAICGIKFFYEQTIGQQWSTLHLVRPPRGQKLPVILSQEEARLQNRVYGGECRSRRHDTAGAAGHLRFLQSP